VTRETERTRTPIETADPGTVPDARWVLGAFHCERHPAWTALFALATLVPLAHVARIGNLPWIAGGLLLAVFPFAGTLALVGLLQFRRELPHESRRWALLWGLLVATAASSYVNGFLGEAPTWRTVVLVAPVVEELAKGTGLLLLMRFGRIRTPVDGIVCALLVGGGFALTENTFYFFNAIAAELGGEDGVLQDVFVMRGLVAPLAHPIFVAGLGLALGARTPRRPLVLLCAFAAGVGLHAIWNHAALSGVVTNFVPHTVALTLALAAAALLRAHREAVPVDVVGTHGETIGARGEPIDAAPGSTRGPTWFAALPWYEPAEGDEAHTRRTDGNAGPRPDKTPGA